MNTIFKAGLLFLSLLILLSGASALSVSNISLNESETVSVDGAVGTANPAAVLCQDLGYGYKIVNELQGQRGVCIFPDGTECDEWAFYAGTCGNEFSYCAVNGMGTISKADGKNPFNPVYAVCVDKVSKAEIGAVSKLFDLEAKSVKASVKISEPTESEASPPVAPLTSTPSSYDLRNATINGHAGNWVTPVRNQRGCGACWAFSALGSVESAFLIKDDTPGYNLDLAEQQLVSNCSLAGNCTSGSVSEALYHAGDPGIVLESAFPDPYPTPTGGCYTLSNPRKTEGFSKITTVQQMKEFISGTGGFTEQSGLSALMGIGDSVGGSWGGNCVYSCTDDQTLNHGIVVVGYNDAWGYWIVKNSYGTTWPEGYPQCNDGGYFKVGYGECGIEKQVYYPIVSDEVQCGKILREDTTLSQDLLGCPYKGLFIGKEEITLNCNGHIIDGQTSSVTGISINNKEGATIPELNNDKFGVTIQNCKVKEFFGGSSGISIIYSNNNTIKNNETTFNSDGIYLQNSVGNILQDNESKNNSSSGINLSQGSFNHLIRNIAENNTIDGTVLSYSSNNEVKENYFMNNGRMGINVLYSNNNNFWDNTFVKGTGLYTAYENSASTGNNWNNGAYGNGWSDYTNPYPIPGSGPGVDTIPFSAYCSDSVYFGDWLNGSCGAITNPVFQFTGRQCVRGTMINNCQTCGCPLSTSCNALTGKCVGGNKNKTGYLVLPIQPIG